MEKAGLIVYLTVCFGCLLNMDVCETVKTPYAWGTVNAGEYCDYEKFEASCASDEIIVVGSATYGHMALGRCVDIDTGHLGCGSDVHSTLHEQCSGKRSCSIAVVAERLKVFSTCSKAVAHYLDVQYACIKAVPRMNLCSSLSAMDQTSYITSVQAEAALCTKATGQYDQEFTITAKPGQKIKFTFINLAQIFSRQTSTFSSQSQLGYILDSKSDAVDAILPGNSIENELPLSRSHQASIFLSSHTESPFLIGFQVTGCPDLTLTSDVLLERDEDKTTVSCHKSQQTWELHCRGNQWIGVIGNCTIASPMVATVQQKNEASWGLPLPKDIILVIIGCSTLFIAILVVTIGYVCLKWPKKIKKEAEKSSSLRRPEIKHMRMHSTGGSDIVYLTPRYSPEGEGDPMSNSDYQPIWEMPLPRPPNNEQATNSRPAAKRNNEDTYNLSLSSNSTDYERKKYFVLDKDFVMNGTTALA